MAETIGTSSTRPVRTYPHVSRTRPNLEVSTNQRPACSYRPGTYLPVSFMDAGTDDFIVIAKGTIVGCDSNGYLVPATGILSGTGVQSSVTDTYTQMDVNAGVKNSGGTLVVAGETYSRSAVLPLGVAYNDIYQDISGRYLNYKMNAEYQALLCEGVIELPYFTFADLASPGTPAAAVALAKAKIGGLAYSQVTGTSGECSDLKFGDKVCADSNGKFVKWEGATAGTPTSDEIRQIAGTVISIETDFPKDYLQHVQTYPYSEVPGSETGGFPANLANVGATRMVKIRLTF